VAATMKDRNVMLWAAPVVETRWGSSCARLERTTRVKKCVNATFGGPSENISAAVCAGFKREEPILVEHYPPCTTPLKHSGCRSATAPAPCRPLTTFHT